MGRKIIFSAGTSILGGIRNIRNRNNCLPLQEGHEIASVTGAWINDLGNDKFDLSAEISTMHALDVNEGDGVALLTTSSAPGPLAATLVSRVAKLIFDVDTQVVEIDGLSLDDAAQFRTSGLPNFVTKLERIVRESRDGGCEPIIGVGSGVKLVLPYLALYGMTRQVRCAYVYETGRQLLWLPRLPLSVDAEALRGGARELRDLDRETAIGRHELRDRLGNLYDRLEGLFETVDNDQMMLSAFGLLFLADLRQAATTLVYLSPNARQAFEVSAGIARIKFHFMLDRIRDPLWRTAHYHTFHGTDLDVYKPGRTAQRVAAWVTSDTVFVAELFPDHDIYERTLPGRRREDYSVEQFTLWEAPREIEVLLTEEEESQNLHDCLQRRVDEAERKADEAEQTLGELADREADRERAYQEKLRSVGTERDLARKEASELRSRFAAMNLAGRLRWLLTGRYD